MIRLESGRGSKRKCSTTTRNFWRSLKAETLRASKSFLLSIAPRLFFLQTHEFKFQIFFFAVEVRWLTYVYYSIAVKN